MKLTKATGGQTEEERERGWGGVRGKAEEVSQMPQTCSLGRCRRRQNDKDEHDDD